MKFWEELNDHEQRTIQAFCHHMAESQMPSLDWCILEDGKPVPADPLTCALWQAKHPELMRIAYDKIGSREVSTVFCCTPMGFAGPCNKDPYYFESMIFKNGEEHGKTRHRTLEEARKGHIQLVHQLRQKT